MSLSESRKGWLTIMLVGICTGVLADAIWDGIKGLIPNVRLSSTELLQLAFFVLTGVGGALIGKRLSRNTQVVGVSNHMQSAPQIFIAAQGVPVRISYSNAVVSFSIFSSSPITLTFVELRLGSALLKEVFQCSIEAFEPRFITLTKTLTASELEQIKSQMTTSQTIQLVGTAKFGVIEQNFDFSTVPMLQG